MWSKIFWISTTLISVSCGAAYVIFSGQAEGFVSPRIVLIVPVLLLNFLVFGVVLTSLFFLISKRRIRFSKHLWIAITAILFCDICLGVGRYIENKLVSETMRRGDQIHSSIESFSSKNGRRPESLEELRHSGYVVPEPALKDSNFSYSTDGKLTFNSIAFMICERRESWVCDD